MKLIPKFRWVLCCIVLLFLFDLAMCPASAPGSTLQVEFSGNRLSLSAEDADIQSVLLRVSRQTGVFVKFPKALQKKISLTLSAVTIEKALEAILKGLNYATVYSVSDNKNEVRVSKVYIFEDYKETARTRRQARREQLNQNRINRYKKRIASIRKRLNSVPQDSPTGRRLKSRIRNYQKTIDRLERQMR